MDLFGEIYVKDRRPPGRRNKNGRRKLHGGTKALLPDTPPYLRFDGRGLGGALQDLAAWIGAVEREHDRVRRTFARTRILGPGDPQYETYKRAWQRHRN